LLRRRFAGALRIGVEQRVHGRAAERPVRAKVRERLKKLVHVNVSFDNEGSKIVIYQPEQA
jgi:hypothetical protein